MKTPQIFKILSLALVLLTLSVGLNAQKREFFQIKTYTFTTDEQVAAVDKYLKEAYLPALKRQKIKSIGVFKPRPNPEDTVKKTYLLIPFASLAQFQAIEAGLAKDKAYLAAGSDYINAGYEQPVYQRLESILLQAFSDMPVLKPTPLDGSRKDRIYELRSYESYSEAIFQNKVDMFNAGGEVKLFKQLGFNAVFYGEVISGPVMPNLMYMTTFDNQKSRDDHWKSFVDSPVWTKLKSRPEYSNNVSHIDITFLYPTDYSDY